MAGIESLTLMTRLPRALPGNETVCPSGGYH